MHTQGRGLREWEEQMGRERDRESFSNKLSMQQGLILWPQDRDLSWKQEWDAQWTEPPRTSQEEPSYLYERIPLKPLEGIFTDKSSWRHCLFSSWGLNKEFSSHTFSFIFIPCFLIGPWIGSTWRQLLDFSIVYSLERPGFLAFQQSFLCFSLLLHFTISWRSIHMALLIVPRNLLTLSPSSWSTVFMFSPYHNQKCW